MGGGGGLLLPVGSRHMSSWATHQRRVPKSSEPGTDFYCPRGTPVYAPADGVIYGYGNTLVPATGRWIGIDLDMGFRFRCMHHSQLVRTSGRVKRGDLIALSGSSGYGSEWFGGSGPDHIPANTGGPHTHVTLWPTHVSRYGYQANGQPFTIDFMDYVGGPQGGGATPVDPDPIPESEEDDAMKSLLIHVQMQDGTDPWYVVDYAAGTAARMHNGLQLDLARGYGEVIEVAGVQPWQAVHGLTFLNNS